MSTTDELDLFKAQIWQALESDNLHTVILEACPLVAAILLLIS